MLGPMTIFSNDLKDFNASLSVGILYFSVPFFKGTGGKIKQTEEDFIVYEILPNGIPIKDGSELGPSLGGMYTHCVLVKSGIDTFTAIKRISQALKIPEKDIGYAGLKDAKAKTYQRISLWGTNFSQFSSLSISNLQLINPIRQKFGVKIGDLSGNLFDIQIKDINRNPSKFEWNFLIKTLNTSGLLNYFGKQRFGSVRPVLHNIGKYLIQRDYEELIYEYIGKTSPLESSFISQLRQNFLNGSDPKEILFSFPAKYRIEKTLLTGLVKNRSSKQIVSKLPSSFLRLSISAYQSYVFNLVLNSLLDVNHEITTRTELPLPGYGTSSSSFPNVIWNNLITILETDSIALADFKSLDKKLRSKGSMRKAKILITDLKINTINGTNEINVSFSLPRGVYATILTREITKVDN